ncbi:MAG: aminoacyl-tRNA hydrolase [Chitinophagales bacterium]|nr:aminoacyl-tRNA hydrolase [Chitinophagales bacterium]MDW8419821.1 aminoacyl-tRNA hydrolase [Chitinophagales bacterium]
MTHYLIAGLGNIGDEYTHTRHNVGFRIADALATTASAPFISDRYAQVATLRLKGKGIYIIKPTTYMNLSGKAVKYWLQQLQLPPENLLVVVDDVALPFGVIRLRGKGSDGGHNGLKDIDACLGHQQYPRLRFGIGNHYPKGRQVDYVLGKWTSEEAAQLDEKIHIAVQAIQSFVLEGIERAMSRFNR